MKPFLIAASLLISVVANCQTNWEKVMLNDAVSISFPSKPIQGGNAVTKSFILRPSDSTVSYIATSSDLQAASGIDAEALQDAMEKEEFWEQAKNSFMANIGTSALLLKYEMTTVQNLKAMNLEINKKNNNGDIDKISVLLFLNGTTTFNIIFNSRGGKADNSLKEQFFKSIELK